MVKCPCIQGCTESVVLAASAGIGFVELTRDEVGFLSVFPAYMPPPAGTHGLAVEIRASLGAGEWIKASILASIGGNFDDISGTLSSLAKNCRITVGLLSAFYLD